MTGEDAGAVAGGPHARPATVLVVEDTRSNRLALRRGVEREGHEVLEAADGREAIDVLARAPVDMVLLDLLMPEVDGFDVLAAMARDPRLHDIPVLVISGVEETEDIARAIEMGAIDCLPKPFDPVLLRVRLRTALEQTRLRRIEQDYLRQELALRQQERLATLGRLSAGLGHELNNPAAAALSTARQVRAALDESEALLPRLLARPDGAELVEAAGRLLQAAHDRPSAAREELVEDLEEALEGIGVAEPWNAATELAELGLTADLVEAQLARFADGAGAALGWLRTRARIRRGIGHLISSVERMAELTSALRGYSYLDRAPQQDVDVRQGLDDTITILRHKLPAGVTVRREYDPHLPAIHAYGGQLNQVWTNLLDNAIAAVGERGTITVRARPGPQGDGVEVEVEDDGPGIPEDVQGSIFEPFVTTKPPGEGTGLGLAISHQIVAEAHRGRVTVRSRPGRTTFLVRLPPAPPRGESDGP